MSILTMICFALAGGWFITGMVLVAAVAGSDFFGSAGRSGQRDSTLAQAFLVWLSVLVVLVFALMASASISQG